MGEQVSDEMTRLVQRVEANFRAAGYDDPNIRVAIEPEALHGLKKQVQNLE
jgi:hypothetical protein